MANYNRKTVEKLRWNSNKRYAIALMKDVFEIVENEVLAELEVMSAQAVAKGKLLELRHEEKEIKDILRAAVMDVAK